jgi:uncharacterized protein
MESIREMIKDEMRVSDRARRPAATGFPIARAADCRNPFGNDMLRLMGRDEAINRLRAHEAELKRLGVARLYLFGSTARGEATESSDVDLFFDYEKGKFGIFELMDVKEYAASILGRPADIMTRDSLHKMIRQHVEASAVRVF